MRKRDKVWVEEHRPPGWPSYWSDRVWLEDIIERAEPEPWWRFSARLVMLVCCFAALLGCGYLLFFVL
jgi:hypothetical protein